jgi:Transposase IS66 family
MTAPSVVDQSAAIGVKIPHEIANAPAARGGAARVTDMTAVKPGRACLRNAAERALRGVALGRRNGTFAGSDEGGRHAAAVYALIQHAN